MIQVLGTSVFSQRVLEDEIRLKTFNDRHSEVFHRNVKGVDCYREYLVVQNTAGVSINSYESQVPSRVKTL